MFARMLLLMSFCLLLSAPAGAQQHRSTVRGTLIGSDGQAISNVPMRMVDERTGEERSFISDANGRFAVVQVEPGSYRVVSDDQRFKAFVARLLVRTNDDIVVTLPLSSGSISSAVDYRTFVLEVEGDAATLRTRLSGEFLTALPLDGRSLANALLLTPQLFGHPSGPRTAGALPTRYWLDGFFNSSAVENAPVVTPQLETIAEFEAAVPVMDTAFGGGGGMVNLRTRAGTNALRGGAFAFFQTAVDRVQIGGFGGGPLARDRTFVFADIEQTRVSDDAPQRESAINTAGRLDHAFTDAARLSARYAWSEGAYFERQGQLFGAALRHAAGSGVNDLRFTIADREGHPIDAAAVPRVFGVADTFTHAFGGHVVKIGGEWQRSDIDAPADLDAQALSAFVQDDWRPSSRLTLQGGLRIDRLEAPEASAADHTHVSPRLGLAWQPLAESGTVVRGGYGRFAEPSPFFANVDAIDQWTVGVGRQWGRTRTIEIAYEGSHLQAFGHVNSLVFEMEQRSEVGLTGHLAYRLAATDLDASVADDDDDLLQKLTGAFTWWLPFGDERRWFSDGLWRDIFGDMRLTGIFAMENMRRDPQTGERSDFKTLDLAILKDVGIARRVLQLRFETFNTFARPNRREFFYPDLLSLPVAGNDGRRYQVGIRYLY